ncbi:polysaccharide biosynthesis protein [Pseudoalteromonas luteoviolacea B = ATCC 29581]|nr:polysaccharide biosynthesis protein [Pseudoalteromonas luteoviolacea B = ATCC 29581]
MNKALLISTAQVYAAKLSIVIVGFFIVAGLARTIEPSTLGDYFWLLSFATVMAVLLRFGRDNSLVKQLTNISHTQQYSTVYAALKVVFGFSALYLVVIALLFFGGYLSSLELTLCIAALPPFIAVVSVFGYWAQATKRPALQQFIGAAPRMLSGAAVLIGVWLFGEVVPLLLALALSALVCSLVCLAYLVYARPSDAAQQQVFDTQTQREAPKYHRYLTIALCSTMMLEGSVLLAGWFTSADEVAKLAIVVRIVSVVSFVLLAFNAVLMPEFAVLAKKAEKRQLTALFQKSRTVSLCCALVVALFVFAIHKPVLQFFGEFFESSDVILLVLIAVQIMKVVVGPTGQLLMMSGYEQIQRNSLMVSVLCLVLCSAWLIPLQGALGAANALFIAVALNNLLGLYYCVKYHQVPWLPFVKVREQQP